jgi:hypothetical protein
VERRETVGGEMEEFKKREREADIRVLRMGGWYGAWKIKVGVREN